jgi:PAS domain-containing protein
MQSALDQPLAAMAADPLAQRLALLKPGLDQLGLPASVIDPALRYRYVNAAYETHTGRAAAEYLGRTPDEVFRLKPEDSRRERMMRALGGEKVVFTRQNLEGPEAGRWVRAHYIPSTARPAPSSACSPSSWISSSSRKRRARSANASASSRSSWIRSASRSRTSTARA